jgi:RimJ/RimL family protein N-acetyltransferase
VIGNDRCMVTLRDVRPADIAVFYEFQADPAANQMAAVATRDRTAHEAHWDKILRDPATVNRTIVDGDVVVGDIASFVVDGQRQLGYRVGREYWNRGIASGAVQLFVAEVELRRPLFADVAEHNLGSLRVLDKAGFTVIGKQSVEDGLVLIVLQLGQGATSTAAG